jgi:proteasome lid subunit RPN8/RPN11
MTTPPSRALSSPRLRGVRIARHLYDEIVAHARDDAPNECCGVVYARDGEAVKVRRATNAAASPLRYDIDAKELFQINEELDEDGFDLGAIYHSHTRSDPVPSQTDINLAMYPDSLYIIVGLKDSEPDVRAWAIREGQVSARRLQVK